MIWLTGLSGSGKSTVAEAMKDELHRHGQLVYILDGDVLRQGLCTDLGYSMADRSENVRRAGEMAAILADLDVVTIVALISPVDDDRERVRGRVGPRRFLEVYVNAPIDVCEARDVKGLYARARRGELNQFTGVSSAYEPPRAADVEVRTDRLTVAECRDLVLARAGLGRAETKGRGPWLTDDSRVGVID